MATFRVEGGNQLKGDITPQGAKNEALQVISAVLLTDQRITISRVPDIKDVNRLIEIMTLIGVEVKRIAQEKYEFCAKNVNLDVLTTKEYAEKASTLRGSVMVLGPLLARFQKAFIPGLGGDKIGRRRLDTHFIGFQKLGAYFEYNSKTTSYTVTSKGRLKGGYMLLEESSVTGTANILMAAALAEGKTTIYNAACEPYLQQLCNMLQRMGANIKGVGSNLLTIEGVEYLKGTEHEVLPDMIEIGSFIGLAALTASEIRIKNVASNYLGIIPNTFRKLGIELHLDGDDIFIPAQDSYEINTFIDGSILTIADAPWPGFTPDLLSIILVTAIQAKGSVLIHQKMFESRLFFTDKLIDMGAQIILCDPHRATIIGLNKKYPLRGISMTSPDIRAGVSLLIASLSAQGESKIHNIEQIDRGYQHIDNRINKLGAKIYREH